MAPKKQPAAAKPKAAATTTETNGVAKKAATAKKPAPTKATAEVNGTGVIKTAKAQARTAASKNAAKENGVATTNGTAKSTKQKSDAEEAAPSPKQKTAAAKADSKKALAPKVNGVSTASKKRKAESEDEASEVEQEEQRPVKKQKASPVPRPVKAPKAPAAPKAAKLGKPINTVPTQVLDIFIFGEGSSGELGLGSKKYNGKLKPIDVKRPRINHNLDSDKVGVVQMACGGMHAVALTKDNKILSWGVNDDKALGRDTTWDGGLRDVDAEDSDDEDDDDTGLNPLESTPSEVDLSDVIPGTKFTQVAATDSASFAVTEDGSVYGWGTFRGNDGIISFSKEARIQPRPALIAGLKGVTEVATGSNHVLALDKDGKVYTWGAGSQYQLGRKGTTRSSGPKDLLRPEACGKFGKRQHAVSIAAGSYHSFYLDNHGRVWSWGLNNYSQTGHNDDEGKDDAKVLIPTVVESLEEFKVTKLAGGEHHSVACTEDGKLLTWGRVDGHQVGVPTSVFNQDNTVYDEAGKPRILSAPTVIPDVQAASVAAGTDTSFALTSDGKAYSWGFSTNYQTGQGTTDDIETPTLIDNTAVREKKLIWAGAGGQYSALAAAADAE